MASVGALGAGVVSSLLRGFEWAEALYLAVVLALLLPCRRAFYRRSALTSQHLSPAWLAAALAVLIGTTWLGFFSYRHVEYSNDLWWQFLAEADAPRFLRATAGLLIAAAVIGALQLLRVSHPEVEPEGSEEAVRHALAAIEGAEAAPSTAGSPCWATSASCSARAAGASSCTACAGGAGWRSAGRWGSRARRWSCSGNSGSCATSMAGGPCSTRCRPR